MTSLDSLKRRDWAALEAADAGRLSRTYPGGKDMRKIETASGKWEYEPMTAKNILAAGLVNKAQPGTKYETTDAGRAALKAWQVTRAITSPVTEGPSGDLR